MNSDLRFFLLLIAVLVFTSGAWILSRYYYLVKNGEVTSGTIIGWKKLHSRRGNSNYIPIVEFSTEKGKKIQLQPVYIQFWLHPYLREGHLVGLIYDRRNPTNALIISVLKIQVYGWMLVTGSIALFIIALFVNL